MGHGGCGLSITNTEHRADDLSGANSSITGSPARQGAAEPRPYPGTLRLGHDHGQKSRVEVGCRYGKVHASMTYVTDLTRSLCRNNIARLETLHLRVHVDEEDIHFCTRSPAPSLKRLLIRSVDGVRMRDTPVLFAGQTSRLQELHLSGIRLWEVSTCKTMRTLELDAV